VTADRAVTRTIGLEPGPVHLNVPVAKPLEPTPTDGDVPASLDPLAVDGRDGPFVETTTGRPTLDGARVDALARDIERADRGLVVCGPADAGSPTPDSLSALLEATDFPLLADPLSGHRFGDGRGDRLACGGYDAYIDAVREWPDPDVVLRFGASPTSKSLRKYLRDVDARQVLVDPAGGWREAEFTATDHLTADPTWIAGALADRVDASGRRAYADRFVEAERRYWSAVADSVSPYFEGAVLYDVVEGLPDPATLFVSNSMPVRDLDRFGRPREVEVTALGNRGASGIDGITSTALGAGSATDDPLVCVLGDLAYYHDMNGLLAIGRCAVDATVVLVDNDGGGIFHKLPIEAFDPPFTDLFKTPHGLDFEPTGTLYDLEFTTASDREAFRSRFERSVGRSGTQVIAVEFDAASSHRRRERLERRVLEALN
jgi:2-succinyl-5-enolpyruvyl-6-hydroxy-3-cyclohexene-1-carboxylate synthase